MANNKYIEGLSPTKGYWFIFDLFDLGEFSIEEQKPFLGMRVSRQKLPATLDVEIVDDGSNTNQQTWSRNKNVTPSVTPLPQHNV